MVRGKRVPKAEITKLCFSEKMQVILGSSQTGLTENNGGSRRTWIQNVDPKHLTHVSMLL